MKYDLPKMVDVTDVEVLRDRVVRLSFDDGCEGVIDLGPKMRGPVFEKAAVDLDYFREIRVNPEIGTIVWPNGADLAPEVLHAQAVERCESPD